MLKNRNLENESIDLGFDAMLSDNFVSYYNALVCLYSSLLINITTLKQTI